MSRQGLRKSGREVSGWVILDKPTGMGSTQAVARVRRLFKARKAGHAGTLDPLATGMLPIALGDATKTIPYVVDGSKTYRFTVRWGQECSTDDCEGVITATSDKRPSTAEIAAVLDEFTGAIVQIPPRFSAIKIAGERAYDLARAGENPEMPARTVQIDRLELLSQSHPDEAEFEVSCGKGTYVRALARDLGRRLSCLGHVAALRRLQVLPFLQCELKEMSVLEDAASIRIPDGEGLEKHDEAECFSQLDSLLVSTGAALKQLPRIQVCDDAAVRLRLGNPVLLQGPEAPVSVGEICAFSRGGLVAIGAVENGVLKPRRVFAGQTR